MSRLEGKRIVVTRARHQADGLVEKIEVLGGIALNYPCIDIALPENLVPLDCALKTIYSYDWVLFTSRNTVRMLAKRIRDLELQIDWTEIKIGAVGAKTAELITKLFNTSADFIPENYSGDDLAKSLPISTYQKVLLPQSSLADSDVFNTLLGERQANVTLVIAYTTIIGQGGDDVPSLLKNNQIDAITFTSPSTVENFVKRLAPQNAWSIPVICIGSTTAERAKQTGFYDIDFPAEHSLDNLINLLQRRFSEV